MDALFLVGRFLFGLLFVVSGLAGHLAGYRSSRVTRPPTRSRSQAPRSS